MKILIIALMFVFTTCTSFNNYDSTMLNGYWIPEKIIWKSPNSGIKEIDESVRYSNLDVLVFYPTGVFMIISSTVSKPKDYDSLIFEFEPGVEVKKGAWLQVSKDSINLTFKETYTTYSGGRSPALENVKKSTALMRLNKSVFFEKKSYNKILTFDSQSLIKINNYANIK